MAYEISLTNLPNRFAAVVGFRTRAEEMASRMPGVYAEVAGFLAQSGMPVEGPAIARYRQLGDAFDVQAGFYVSNSFPPADGFTCIALPSGEAAVTTHVGSYDGLPAAYALQGWGGGRAVNSQSRCGKSIGRLPS